MRFAASSFTGVAVCAAVIGGTFSSNAFGVALTPGNIIVNGSDNAGNFIKEFTRTGTLVQRFTPAGAGLDLAVDRADNIQFMQNSFPTDVVELNPRTGASQTRSYAGLSTVGNLTYGAIGTIGRYVFAADSETANVGAPKGVVRFDLDGGPTVRFATNTDEVVDLNVGLDGRLYVLGRGSAFNAGGNRVDIYDPTTMTFVRSVNLAVEMRGIAADANGDVYGAKVGGGTDVYRYNANGTLLDSLATNGDLGDIDIAANGTIVASSFNGGVFVTDRNLDTFTSFTSGANGYRNFTAIVPEPSTATALVFVGMLGRRRRSGGDAG